MKNKVLATPNETLPYLSNQERLNVYQILVDGCSHIYSKGKLQKDRALSVLNTLLPLTEKDPYFLAHLTSYALKKTKSKDLQVFTTYVNALNSANGMPFSPGSKYLKPNLRIIGASALHMLDPILASHVLELATMKFSVPNFLNEGTHFPSFLRTSFGKYLEYREINSHIMKRAKQAGLGPRLVSIYRILHKSPPDEIAAILRWQQKDHKIEFAKSELDFSNLDDLAIAEKIRKEKLPVLGVLSALPRQMSPVIAVALLEQATGNQAVILRKLFEDSGVLKDPEVMKLYEEKIKTAKTALDRAKILSETASEEVKKVLLKSRSEARKEEVGDIGKIFVHIDASGSMDRAFDVACEKGAIIAEMVKDPQQNFAWGYYNTVGRILPLPQEFIEDAFRAILYGKRADGGTDSFSLYRQAREFGADCDVQISDGGHNTGDLDDKIRSFHQDNPNLTKPKVMVLIQVEGSDPSSALQDGYEANQIPVAILKPSVLSESALVSASIRTALLGPISIIQEISDTPLLELPNWYFTI